MLLSSSFFNQKTNKQTKNCITLMVTLLSISATFISPTCSQLSIPWASLSAMDSNYSTVQSCLGTTLMIFDKVVYSCNMIVPKLSCFPQRKEKQSLKMLSKSDCEEGIYIFGFHYLISLLLVNSRVRVVTFLLKAQ